ncbi:hypothetical protein [Streptomyces sp. NPDC017941]|uniref:hypothetical protein n=1 Tax=Streptomyces sp. NPDC017941 TaxID=3365018 RepID=UPI0037A99486
MDVDGDGGGTVPEVLLLLPALLRTLACAVFVAAGFSLAIVEHGDLERASVGGADGECTSHAVRAFFALLSREQGEPRNLSACGSSPEVRCPAALGRQELP